MVRRWHDCAGIASDQWRRKKRDIDEPDDHALGRSRGGFTTKIHFLCDENGQPIAFELTAGQTHESTVFDKLLATAADSLWPTDETQIAWPLALAGDKGYRANWIDRLLLELGIRPVIPSKSSETSQRIGVVFNRVLYRARNIVERLIGWLKENRRIFSRFEKTAKNFGGMLKMAFIKRYLKMS